MGAKVVFLFCANYQAEAEQALREEQLADTVSLTFPAHCGRPGLNRADLECLLTPFPECERVEIYGGHCLHSLNWPSSEPYQLHIHRLEQCCHLVAEPALVCRCLQQGSYLTTPGWLAQWPKQLKQLGLDQQTARDLFAETTSSVVLLDTGVGNTGHADLQAFAAYIGRPAEVIHTGIALLRLLLARTVLTWRMERTERKAQEMVQQVQQQSAQYAMAIDLLANLAESNNEAKAVEAMLDVYQLLFAPQRLCYLSLQEKKTEQLWIRSAVEVDGEERQRISETLTGWQGESGATATGDGFVLRIVQHGQQKGMVAVEHIAFPEHLDHYLNLALTIVNICELPIENARRYERIVQTEEMLRQANATLVQLSTTDTLTGIANRRAYDSYLGSEWKKMLRNRQPLSLLVCDIDCFKNYNDHYGHKAGDSCLRRVAQLIRQEVARPGDFVARYGGEEFVVLLPNTAMAGACHLAEKIRLAVDESAIPHGHSATADHITLSLGVAEAIPPLPTEMAPETLFQAADAALYQAKDEGRNRVVCRQLSDTPTAAR